MADLTRYRITNEVLGTVIVVAELPAGVSVGTRDIGPSWNNRRPPRLIVEKLGASEAAGEAFLEGVPERDPAIVEYGYKFRE